MGSYYSTDTLDKVWIMPWVGWIRIVRFYVIQNGAALKAGVLFASGIFHSILLDCGWLWGNKPVYSIKNFGLSALQISSQNLLVSNLMSNPASFIVDLLFVELLLLCFQGFLLTPIIVPWCGSEFTQLWIHWDSWMYIFMCFIKIRNL